MNTTVLRCLLSGSHKFQPFTLFLCALQVALWGCGSSSQADDDLRAQALTELKQELRPTVLAELRQEQREQKTQTPSPAEAPSEPALPKAPPETPPSEAAPPPPSESPEVYVSARQEFTELGTRLNSGDGAMRLSELYIAGNLENKLPADIRETFERAPEIIYCYSVLESSLEDSHVTHVWRRDGRLVSRVELNVSKSPKWRTWSKQRTSPIARGHWSCEVLGPTGTSLGLVVVQTQS